MTSVQRLEPARAYAPIAMSAEARWSPVLPRRGERRGIPIRERPRRRLCSPSSGAGLRIPTDHHGADLVANLRAQVRGAQRHTVQRHRMAHLLQRTHRQRQQRNRREGRPHTGGPRPALTRETAPPRTSGLDKGHVHNNRLLGHQPVRDSRRHGRGVTRANRYDVTILSTACRWCTWAQAARGRPAGGVQPDRALPARQLLGRDRALRVRPARRHQQWHPDEVLLEHHATPAPQQASSARRRVRKYVQQLRVHLVVGRRGNQPIRISSALRRPSSPKHPLLKCAHPLLRADLEAAVPDRRDRADPPPNRDIPQPGHRLGTSQAGGYVWHTTGQEDVDELQDGTARVGDARDRQGALRRRP